MTRVLGIDPGIARMGYGLVAEAQDQSLAFLDCGILTTPKEEHLPARLQMLYHDLQALQADYTPTVLAIEQLYFGRNSSTAFAVGQACGIVNLVAAQAGIPVFAYSPAAIKQALTGSGRADKQQVMQMVTLVLHLSGVPKPDDAADGLAVALCYLYQSKYQQAVQSHPADWPGSST